MSDRHLAVPPILLSTPLIRGVRIDEGAPPPALPWLWSGLFRLATDADGHGQHASDIPPLSRR